MKNYDVVAAPEDITTKSYVDNVVTVTAGTTPTGSEIWIDTSAPDPTETLEERVASLEARIEELEARTA